MPNDPLGEDLRKQRDLARSWLKARAEEEGEGIAAFVLAWIDALKVNLVDTCLARLERADRLMAHAWRLWGERDGALEDLAFVRALTAEANRAPTRVVRIERCVHCDQPHDDVPMRPPGRDRLGWFDCWEGRCPTTGRLLARVFEDVADNRMWAARAKASEAAKEKKP